MARVSCTLSDGRRLEASGADGTSLMRALTAAGAPLDAICGGACSCATCHVLVAAPWRAAVGPAGEAEVMLLESTPEFDPAASRLSCQIILHGGLEGLLVAIPPES